MTAAGDHPSGPGARTVLTGLVGTTLVAVAAMDGGALLRRDGGDWPIPLPHLPSFGTASVLPVVFAYFLGLVLLVRAWLALRRAAPAVRTTIAVAALWSVPLLLGPPVGSRDAYSYVAQGEIARIGLPAYDHAADDLPPGAIRDGVDPLWFEVPAPYGPAWVKLAAGGAALPGSQPFVGVLAMRALALAGVALLALSIPRLAARLGRDATDATVLVVANPLVLVHLVAGAHNEALLAGLLAAGFAAAARGRRYVGVAVCSLGGAVKLPGIIGAAVLGWGADKGTPLRTRLAHTAVAGAVSVAVLVLCSALTGLGFGWIESSVAPGLVTSWAAPTNWLGSVIGLDLAQNIGLAVAGGLAARWTWGAAPADAAATGKILVALAILGPALHPWYLLWGFPLLAAASAGRPNRVLVGASIVGVFAGHLGSGPFIDRLLDEPALVLVAAVAVLVAFAATSRDVRALVVGTAPEPAAAPAQ